MNEYAAHAAALQATQDNLADSCPVITWSGQNFNVIPGSALRRQDLTPGGLQLNADFEFEALVSTFGNAPAAALKSALLTPSIISYLGDDYKAFAVKIRPGGLQIRVECNSATQAA